MKKSKIVAMIMTIVTVFSFAVPVIAVEEVETKVYFNGKEINFEDASGKVTPQIINNRTMVPLRKIFETIGAEVTWNGEEKIAYAEKDDLAIELQIGNNNAKVIRNGNEETILLDSEPVIIDGRTLVPVRFVSESLKMKVGWEQATRSVTIIDTSFILETVKKEAPIFYELLLTETEMPKSHTTEYSIKGNVKYTNTEDKSSNSTLKYNADMKLEENEENYHMKANVTSSGKGMLIDALKEFKFDNVDYETFLNKENMDMYFKSSTLLDQYEGKWIKMKQDDGFKLPEYGNITLYNNEQIFQGFIDMMFDEIELKPSTYNDIEQQLKLYCKFVKDDFFTVSGRTTKTYTYQISLKDVKKILSEENIKAPTYIDGLKNANIKLTSKFQDNVQISNTISFFGSIVVGSETLDISADAAGTRSNINKKINMTLPKNNIIEFN